MNTGPQQFSAQYKAKQMQDESRLQNVLLRKTIK